MRVTEIVLGFAAVTIVAAETASVWLDAPTMVAATSSQWPWAFCLLLTAADIALGTWFFTPAENVRK
jgi:hypothetical protein